MAAVHAPRRPAVPVERDSKAEEVLDLVPAADDERDRDRDQDEQRDVEAIAREAVLLAAHDARVPPRPVVSVAELDRGRVERDVVVGL